MSKRQYSEPEVVIRLFEEEDILTYSGENDMITDFNPNWLNIFEEGN